MHEDLSFLSVPYSPWWYNVVMKYYGYDAFSKDVKVLSEKVKPFEPEAIIAIARGGMMLAQLMAHALHIRNVQSIRTEGYDGDHKRDDVKIFGSCDLHNVKRVVIVDDIVDSGDTLEAILGYLKSSFPEVTFITAAIFYKPTAVVQPDHAVRVADEWISFFWEADFA